jgi:hypothetical protein
LRALGKGILQINVTDEQVDDRIDEALKYYYDYHFDGSDRVYLRHQITATDITNKYIDTPENVIGITQIFDVGRSSSINVNNIFSFTYQYALHDMYNIHSTSMIPYYTARMNINLIEELLVGAQPVRYNRHMNRLYVDMDWSRVNEGDFLVVEAYQIVDPEEYTDVWSDRWLQRYTEALIKRQWGSNLKKFGGMQLPGGIIMNGQQIYEEAVEEIEKLEQEMITSYSLPVYDMMG